MFTASLNSDHAILCLTETWLSSGVNDSELFCDYNVYCIKSREGGVLIATHKRIHSMEKQAWNSDAEYVWTTVYMGEGPKINICCVYIPPKNDR